MIDVVSRKNQKIAVLGLGISGLTSAEALRRSGANVTVWDDNQARRDKAVMAGLNVVELTNPHISTLDALLASLPEYADAATALANGVAVGGLYRVTGSTTAAGIRAVASYTP